jgi:excisionase family DNA binding protein
MPDVERLIYRVPDVAKLLGMTELAARRAIERGEIPSRKWGRRIVVLAADLKAHMEALRPASTDGTA